MGVIASIDWWAPDLGPQTPQNYIPKHDPMLGFENGRKMRTVKTTLQEMESAHVEPQLRDYCIDEFMKYLECRNKVFPFNFLCKHEIHKYHDCQYLDHELRMKELEREKRLDNKFAKKKEKE